jgi:hypothetical protein
MCLSYGKLVTLPAVLLLNPFFLPQTGRGADNVEGFKKDLFKFDSWGVSHILSFNEPDQTRAVGGSEIAATNAADAHKRAFTAEVAGKYKIGAPAVARGGKKWLSVSS